MKAALVVEMGKPPIYGDYEEPVPADGEVRVRVSAAALSSVVKSRASGKHYSSSGQLPFVVGTDGAGQLDDCRRVYFVLPKAPFGSMSEQTVVRLSQCVFLPDDLDDVTAAAIANPGMSAWAALKERAKLIAGETVLVNGATGTAGRLAVQIAKHMGAKKVVATRGVRKLGSHSKFRKGPTRNERAFCVLTREGQMIISMKLHAKCAEIEAVRERINDFGYKVHSITGEEHVVIGVRLLFLTE